MQLKINTNIPKINIYEKPPINGQIEITIDMKQHHYHGQKQVNKIGNNSINIMYILQFSRRIRKYLNGF